MAGKTPEAGRKLMRPYTIANGALLDRYHFTHPDLCRVFYQDLRRSVRSLISSRSTLAPEIHFTNTEMVIYSALGYIKFILTRKHSLPRLRNEAERRRPKLIMTPSLPTYYS